MLFITLTRLILASPDGAPKCAINEAAISSGMNSASDQTLGYSSVIKNIGGGKFNISFSNPSRIDYQGLLMYVNTKENPLTHLGAFTLPDLIKWRYQTESICNAGKIVGLKSSTVTHATPARAPLNIVFQLELGDKELLIQGLQLNAVIASLDSGISGFPKWQNLPPSTISIGASTATTKNQGSNSLDQDDLYDCDEQEFNAQQGPGNTSDINPTVVSIPSSSVIAARDLGGAVVDPGSKVVQDKSSRLQNSIASSTSAPIGSSSDNTSAMLTIVIAMIFHSLQFSFL